MRAPLLFLAVLAGATVAAAAPGAACVPSCDVASTYAAFASPVVAVTSGSVVAWRTVDVAHTATADDHCFHVVFSGPAVGRVAFDLRDGVAYAKVGSTERPCSGSVLPNGVVDVAYTCIFHSWMTGSILVGS